jgi:hypothetical protein
VELLDGYARAKTPLVTLLLRPPMEWNGTRKLERRLADKDCKRTGRIERKGGMYSRRESCDFF